MLHISFFHPHSQLRNNILIQLLLKMIQLLFLQSQKKNETESTHLMKFLILKTLVNAKQNNKMRNLLNLKVTQTILMTALSLKQLIPKIAILVSQSKQQIILTTTAVDIIVQIQIYSNIIQIQ